MKAVIPLAGRGARLRPQTHRTPKALLKVGGRPVLGYLLDKLLETGIEEIVFIVGYLREAIRDYIAEEYPSLDARHVVQEVQDGTAGAVHLAEPYIDEEVLILFADTLFEADLSLVRELPPEWAGVMWAKEVEDYQRFGVIVTDGEGAMKRIVEKPTEPVSKLANIGLYYVRDHQLLFEGIGHTLSAAPGPSGEFHLTDAFQYMVDRGAGIRTAPVANWYDCGKRETLLETNGALLRRGRGGISEEARIEEATIREPARIEGGAVAVGSVIGPGVTVEAGARIVNSTIVNSIIGAGAVVENSDLRDSLVGAQARVSGFRGRLDIVDDSQVVG